MAELRTLLEEAMEREGITSKIEFISYLSDWLDPPGTIPRTTGYEWFSGALPTDIRYRRALENCLNIAFTDNGAILTQDDIRKAAIDHLYTLIPVMEATRRHLLWFVEHGPVARRAYQEVYREKDWRVIGTLFTSLPNEEAFQRWLQLGGEESLKEQRI